MGGAALAATGRAAPVFLVNACAALLFLLLVKLIRRPRAELRQDAVGEADCGGATRDAAASSPARSWRARLAPLVAGFRFVWRTPVLLAAITLEPGEQWLGWQKITLDR